MSEENREKYNRWSEFYDTYPNPTVAMDDLSFPQYLQAIRHISVLELGCGTGRHTVRLVQQENLVTGIDLSPGMLAVARKRCASNAATFVEADLSTLDRLDLPQVYDAAVCSLVLEHVADVGSLFDATRRRVRQGGRFYLSEIHPTRAMQGRLAHFKLQDGEEIALRSVVHRDGDLERAASAHGWQLEIQRDILGDRKLAALNPKWERHLGQPLLRQWCWRAI